MGSGGGISTGSFSIDNTVQFDDERPAVTIRPAAGPGPVAGTAVAFDVVFSEPVLHNPGGPTSITARRQRREQHRRRAGLGGDARGRGRALRRDRDRDDGREYDLRVRPGRDHHRPGRQRERRLDERRQLGHLRPLGHGPVLGPGVLDRRRRGPDPDGDGHPGRRGRGGPGRRLFDGGRDGPERDQLRRRVRDPPLGRRGLDRQVLHRGHPGRRRARGGLGLRGPPERRQPAGGPGHAGDGHGQHLGGGRPGLYRTDVPGRRGGDRVPGAGPPGVRRPRDGDRPLHGDRRDGHGRGRLHRPRDPNPDVDRGRAGRPVHHVRPQGRPPERGEGDDPPGPGHPGRERRCWAPRPVPPSSSTRATGIPFRPPPSRPGPRSRTATGTS